MPGRNIIGPEAARLAVLGRLTRGALHELGNPLVALVGTAELAAGSPEAGSRLRARLDLIARSADEIADIVRALQSVARVSAGEELRPVDLSTEAASAIGLVRRLSPRHATAIDGTPSTSPALAEAPPGALLVALVALLLDALDATPHGAVSLVVSQGEGHASVLLANTRPGAGSHVLATAAGATLVERPEGVALVLPSAV